MVRVPSQRLESPMVHRGEVQEAFPFSDGSTPEFIRPAQRGLASPRGIFTQQRRVFVFKTCLRPSLASCSYLHGRIPVNRETRTSASSLPLLQSCRILSAALCRFAIELSVSVKPLRLPSVAHITVP